MSSTTTETWLQAAEGGSHHAILQSAAKLTAVAKPRDHGGRPLPSPPPAPAILRPIDLQADRPYSSRPPSPQAGKVPALWRTAHLLPDPTGPPSGG